MTLLDDRPTRVASRPARTEAPALESIPAAPAPAPVAMAPSPIPAALVVEVARDDVFRVTDGSRVVGYIQLAGPVYVTLLGAVYNTSVEIAQCLDLDAAIARLECARG